MASLSLHVRDLKRELAADQPTAKKKARQPTSAEVLEQLSQITGGPLDACPMCLLVEAEDFAIDKAKEREDEAWMTALTLVPGQYWFTGAHNTFM